MGILDNLFKRPKPDFLNNALCAYVATFPNQDRLADHLHRLGSAQHFDQVKSTLDETLASGYGYIAENAQRVDWNSAAFTREMEAHLLSRYPWLRSGGLGSIRSYCMYLCWKDGYDFGHRT